MQQKWFLLFAYQKWVYFCLSLLVPFLILQQVALQRMQGLHAAPEELRTDTYNNADAPGLVWMGSLILLTTSPPNPYTTWHGPIRPQNGAEKERSTRFMGNSYKPDKPVIAKTNRTRKVTTFVAFTGWPEGFALLNRSCEQNNHPCLQIISYLRKRHLLPSYDIHANDVIQMTHLGCFVLNINRKIRIWNINCILSVKKKKSEPNAYNGKNYVHIHTHTHIQ